MLPILITIGPFSLKTLNLFLVLTLFVSSFIFWRFGRGEHYKEDQLFDAFLSSFIAGLVFARIVYVLINFQEYGWNVLSWMNIWADPGFAILPGLLGASVYLFRHATKQKWEQYAILDMWMPAILGGAVVLELGLFFDRPIQGLFGFSEWWASSHLWLAVIFGIIAWYARFSEFRYRTFSWYKRKHQVAQTGYVFGLGLVLSGIALALAEVLIYIQNITAISITSILGLSGVIIGGLAVWILRSGFFSQFRSRKKPIAHA